MPDAISQLPSPLNTPAIDNCSQCRPDGTELSMQLRPELYQALESLRDNRIKNSTLDECSNEDGNKSGNKVPETANAAIFATYKSNEEAIEDVCFYIENNLSDIIQLPELFFISDKSITHNPKQLAHIEYLSKKLIELVSKELRSYQYVCTSLVLNGTHQAVIISEDGLFATQQQLHFCNRYNWTALGDDLNIIELPLEQGSISLAMLAADDANIPEMVKLAALNNIQVLLVPFDIQEPSELEQSLLAHAAEHRICIVAATREKSFGNDLSSTNTNTTLDSNNGSNTGNKRKVVSSKSTGFIANLAKEPASPMIVKQQHGKITKAVIHPIEACNKV